MRDLSLSSMRMDRVTNAIAALLSGAYTSVWAYKMSDVSVPFLVWKKATQKNTLAVLVQAHLKTHTHTHTGPLQNTHTHTESHSHTPATTTTTMCNDSTSEEWRQMPVSIKRGRDGECLTICSVLFNLKNQRKF